MPLFVFLTASKCFPAKKEQPMKKKFSISKTFQLNKDAGDAERVLYQLLHEMGYRVVTAYHWELSGPLVLGIYRVKWIPKRYLDVEIIAHKKDISEVTLHLSYYLKQKKYKDKIAAIFEKELNTISEILKSDKKRFEQLEDLEIKSLKEESGIFRDVVLSAAIVIAFFGFYLLSKFFQKDYIVWLFMVIILVQIFIVFWFRNQDSR
ncbi:hypothetical protein AT05_01030 [Schleiferia thermophila str. Yellowstone]|jgi:hypothetical protein|uniref:Uncharacterized protein n=2 Tax=Schleiferia thermophila TaxID=884107 RepID=A0A369A7V4_9FLAO|nr:hypothetical protein AT05_01030 [Schleiferia thermophila str. Yellowstone]RCX05442.1 hypothetical protein DES35_101727 [Schleiferia thermophila]